MSFRADNPGGDRGRRARRGGAICALAASLTAAAAADVIEVPADEPTIQDAIDLAEPGDEVVVAAGVYNESIDFLGKAITVRSSDGAAVTILDGAGVGDSLVKFMTGEGVDSILRGFTLSMGTGNLDLIGIPVGGGVLCLSTAPTIVDCRFIGNDAAHGGAVYANLASPTLRGCLFQGNTAILGGAVFNTFVSSTTLSNCLLIGNGASADGGAVYNENGSTARLRGCTVTDNSAGGDGGGVANDGSDPVIANTIIAGNTSTGGAAPDLMNDPGSTPDVRYSLIAGSGGSVAWNAAFGVDGGGNLDEDPRFIDAASGDYGLCRFSPCIDAGNNADVGGAVTADFAGNPRFVDDIGIADTGAGTAPITDIGAFEHQFDSLPQQINLFPGASIQAVLNCAVGGDEIVLAPGVYRQVFDFMGQAVTLRSSLGPAVTIIDGTGLGESVISFIDGEGPDSVLEGLTITGGEGNATVFGVPVGGGIFVHEAGPVIRDCIIDGNTADFGAGVYLNTTTAVIEDCTITNNEGDVGAGLRVLDGTPEIRGTTIDGNTANDRGGGVAVALGAPVIEDCVLTGNEAVLGGGMVLDNGTTALVRDCRFAGNGGSNGGGLAIEAAVPTVLNCVFDDNDAAVRGAGIHCSSSRTGPPLVAGCLFTSNLAMGFGGGMEIRDSAPDVVNCTFTDNTSLQGGGIHCEVLSEPRILNCILWGNTAPDGPEIRNTSGAVPLVAYSDVAGSGGSAAWDTALGANGGGNVDADPLFAGAPGDLRLGAGSPCIDAADTDEVPAALDVDLDGNPRVADDPATPDTGAPPGMPPIVDMGAYEVPGVGAPACPADVNGDDAVDVLDLVAVVLDWGTDGSGHGGDVDGNGLVDVLDLVAVVLAWGACP